MCYILYSYNKISSRKNMIKDLIRKKKYIYNIEYKWISAIETHVV